MANRLLALVLVVSAAQAAVAVTCKTRNANGGIIYHTELGDVDTCTCGLLGGDECPSPGRVFDPAEAHTVCPKSVCEETVCCKATKCYNSGNNGGQHICEDPALTYGNGVDTVECPAGGCTDDTCCMKPDVALRHSPDDPDGSSGPLGLTTLEFVMCIVAIVLLVLLILLICCCVCCKSGSKADPESDQEFDSEQEEKGMGHGAAAVHDKEDQLKLDGRI